MYAMTADQELSAARTLFEPYDRPYWIAGGWAVDLHLGRTRRAHSDVDVQILARDLEEFAATFKGRGVILHDHRSGEEKVWEHGAPVEPGRNTLILEPGIEVMVALSEGDEWVYHRGSGRTRRPLAEIGEFSASGIPYIRPEVVPLFKARDGRQKDDDDFADLLPTLTAAQAAWLLPRLTPPGQPQHRWARRLAERISVA
jgi:hypothetical protein